MTTNFKPLRLLIFCLYLCTIGYSQSKVKVWQEPLTLPTYLAKAPDKNPMFFRNQSYQGASRYIYPYALEDNLTDKKVDKTYQALYLENEYLKVCVLPEIGGRLFYATDKTNGYEMFYRQNVIKPANIGMLGAWISGGIEFCVFHHHRASTNIPVDYKLEENPDGSATIWIGETEPRHRMKWTLGISLYPGKSYLEVDGRLINPTENTNSILYWANVATHVNEDYQVIFPPSTDFAVYHAKNSFAHWPVTSNTYNGKPHYQNNIDASWWKNHPDPISMFAHEIKEGFLAGYDHGKQAGTMHVANHHIVKGAKLWEWGPGDYGAMWDSKVLTDSDGPYAELMTGAYSDNQPDYSWLKPYEYKTFKQYWYPLRETGGALTANLNGTLNIKNIEGDDYWIAANVTQPYKGAKILVKQNETVVFDTATDISPDHPFAKTIQLARVDDTELSLHLHDADDNALVAYHPVKKESNPPLPETVVPPAKPEEISSLEELYLTGLRIKQFHNARIDPEPYFQEALKRDPLDVRSNTMMGILRKQDFQMEEAANYFRQALKRLTANYTRPRNGEPFYHLGVILKHQEKYDAAYDTLYRAAWDQDFAAAAYYQLAELSVRRSDYARALTEIDRSLDYNSSNIKALNLKIGILRAMGDTATAQQLVTVALEKDPLNFRSIRESVLLGLKGKAAGTKFMRDNPESYLELAVEYLNAGMEQDAKAILLEASHSEHEGLKQYPTVHYYLGYLFARENNTDKATKHFNTARSLPVDYCFPFRYETIAIYEKALAANPSDPRAHYYLGNLWYDKQPQKAIEHWEKAAELEPSFAIAYRNLGWGYHQTFNDLSRAIVSYEKAIELNPNDPRLYYELDRLYEKNGAAIEKRYQLLTANHEVVAQRPDALLQEIKLLLLKNESETAIDYLVNHFFPRQEGVDNLHDIYVDACLSQGISELAAKAPEKALSYFRMADQYPENHQIARRSGYQRDAQILFYQAKALAKMGEKEQADAVFRKVAALDIKASQYQFYKALAHDQLGQTQHTETIAATLHGKGKELLAEEEEVDFFSKFGEGQSRKLKRSEGHFLLGLSYLLTGKRDLALKNFGAAAELNPHDLWVLYYLGSS